MDDGIVLDHPNEAFQVPQSSSNCVCLMYNMLLCQVLHYFLGGEVRWLHHIILPHDAFLLARSISLHIIFYLLVGYFHFNSFKQTFVSLSLHRPPNTNRNQPKRFGHLCFTSWSPCLQECAETLPDPGREVFSATLETVWAFAAP